MITEHFLVGKVRLGSCLVGALGEEDGHRPAWELRVPEQGTQEVVPE